MFAAAAWRWHEHAALHAARAPTPVPVSASVAVVLADAPLGPREEEERRGEAGRGADAVAAPPPPASVTTHMGIRFPSLEVSAAEWVLMTIAGGTQAPALLPLFLCSLAYVRSELAGALVVYALDGKALQTCRRHHPVPRLCVAWKGVLPTEDRLREAFKHESTRRRFYFLNAVWAKADLLHAAVSFYQLPVTFLDVDLVFLRDPTAALLPPGGKEVWISTNGNPRRGKDFNTGTLTVRNSTRALRIMAKWRVVKEAFLSAKVLKNEQDGFTEMERRGDVQDSEVAVLRCGDVMTGCCYSPQKFMGGAGALEGSAPVLYHAACVDSGQKPSILKRVIEFVDHSQDGTLARCMRQAR